jgi:hypothetical protein
VGLWGTHIPKAAPFDARTTLRPSGATTAPKRGGQSQSAPTRLELTRRGRFPYPVLFGLQQRLDERCYSEGPAGVGSLRSSIGG